MMIERKTRWIDEVSRILVERHGFEKPEAVKQANSMMSYFEEEFSPFDAVTQASRDAYDADLYNEMMLNW